MTAVDVDPDLAPWPESRPLPQAPRAPKVRQRRPIKPLLTKAFFALTIAAVVFWIHDRVITTLTFDQRQEHLSAEMKSGTPTIESGEAVAILQATDIDLNVVVIEDVTVENLRGAPARVTASAMPGDAGVSVIFGHRRAYGGPFERVGALVKGQSIVVQTRSGGPITRYIVDRVETSTTLANVRLDNEERLSYLLLVTNESSWTSNEQTIVVARALPVTDADPTVPQLGGLSAQGLPFGLDTVGAVLAGVAATLSWTFLRGRTGTALRAAIVAPGAIYAVIGALMTLDGLLPMAR